MQLLTYGLDQPETFNPKRSRITVGSLPKGHQIKPYVPEFVPESPISGPTTIRGNHFLGPGMILLLGISRKKKLVTFITEPRHGIPFKGVGSFNISLNDSLKESPNDPWPESFNGYFIVKAGNGRTLTYFQEKTDKEVLL